MHGATPCLTIFTPWGLGLERRLGRAHEVARGARRAQAHRFIVSSPRWRHRCDCMSRAEDLHGEDPIGGNYDVGPKWSCIYQPCL